MTPPEGEGVSRFVMQIANPLLRSNTDVAVLCAATNEACCVDSH